MSDGKVAKLRKAMDYARNYRYGLFGSNNRDFTDVVTQKRWDPEMPEEDLDFLTGYGEGNLWSWKEGSPQIDRMDQLIKKHGVPQDNFTLYRGLELPEDFVASLRNGDTLYNRLPSSQSLDPDMAEEFSNMGQAEDSVPTVVMIRPTRRTVLPLPVTGQSEMVMPSGARAKLLIDRILRTRRGNIEIEAERTDEPHPGFAEGGKVKESKFDTYVKRPLSGLASQWMGRDEDGNMVAPDIAPIAAMLKYLKGEKPVRPGIVDEIRSLPGLAYDAANWATDTMQKSDVGHAAGLDSDAGDAVQDWLFRKPEAIANAERGADENFAASRRMLDLPEADGFEQNLAESAGVMLGQIPVPGSFLRRLKMLRDHSGAAKIAAPALEWLTPTIEPKLANYVAGTGFGGLTGGGMDWLADLSEEEIEDALIEEAMHEVLQSEIQPTEQDDDTAIEQFMRGYHE